MRISYINGLCAKNDAISNAIRDEIAAIKDNQFADVRLFGYSCDHDDIPFNKVNGAADIILDRHYQASDLVVFHFGIYYPLFNLLPVVQRRAKRLVVFHNITPKFILPEKDHAVIDKSFSQMANMVWADHVLCDSETNLEVLRSAGISTPASVIPLAIHSGLSAPPRKPSFSDNIIRIVYVGRFVRSKGPHDLLAALSKAVSINRNVNLQLDMVGNLVFSDQELLSDIRQTTSVLQERFGTRISIRIHGDAPDETKHRLLRDADLFVLPTYHEGFCVPIVEALASGCKVIAYENSNTPAISGGLAMLTPTGDVEKLSGALFDAIRAVTAPAWHSNDDGGYQAFTRAAHQHVQQFAPERVEQQFLRFLKTFVDIGHTRTMKCGHYNA